MRRDRWRQIDELFEAALERDPGERAAFLDEACGDDTALRREVEKMVEFDARAGTFIETHVFDVAAGLLTTEAGAAPGGRAAAERAGVERAAAAFEPIDDARFAPGDRIADRYRVAGLLGRGGMGEVYRADDLKLKQAVALKFLPERLSADGAALARFYQEVSVARQISHRHVCRVYDVGEAAGHHFISMEFVRGEELSSLLKRIGRLPSAKALEIARQLCAGLAAIHERGVLHRDLKPANVMLDHAGDVRITDFGLAALAGEVRGREAMAGTPAYMSPEQIAGAELTVRSDIYSLGLVLYEVFTGKRAFEATSLQEMMRLRQSDTTPTNPSEHVDNIDPLVERVILRCLEREPGLRPASALEVAASLPGGDPLAAALAAGETPSPEMVAAAATEGALAPRAASVLLLCALAGLAAVCLVSGSALLHRRVPLEKPPEVLRERAREVLARSGHDAPATDSADGFSVRPEYLNYVVEHDSSPDRWDGLATAEPPVLLFWYRSAPDYLVPLDNPMVAPADPPRDAPGSAAVSLDTRGRLRGLHVVPRGGAGPAAAGEPDWAVLFAEAGLDMARFAPAEPERLPPTFADARAAWEGVYPERPEVPVRVEAAAYRGEPVFFEVVHPWDGPLRQGQARADLKGRVLVGTLIAVALVVLSGSVLLAARNLRLGRGDRRGAFRLALVVFSVLMAGWLFEAHHVPTSGEFLLFVEGVATSLFFAAFLWVVYVALEPFVRRRWPEQIISWSRLLAGGWRDPMVGRDVMIGLLFGAGMVLTGYLRTASTAWLGLAPGRPAVEPGAALLGLRYFPASLTAQTLSALQLSLMLLFVLVLLSILLRRRWAAGLAGWALATLLIGLIGSTAQPVAWLFASLSALLVVATLYRFGLLASIAALFVVHAFVFFPVTSELTAWYGTGFALDLAIMVALALYGFHASLAGQPLFGGALLDD